MKGRGRLAWLAPLLSLACTQPSSACGFHNPDDLGIQRAGLSWSFPKASYVQGAVSMAMSAGILRLSDRLQRGDLFGFHRVAAKFQALASRIDGGGTRLKAPVSIVLIGPMLWSVITPSPDGLAVRTHTDGPAPGAAVIITDVPVLAALLSGDLSSQTAEAAGLIRIYGPANMVMNTRAALRDAFPDKKHAASRSPVSLPN
jgi:hypothetical protein